MAEVKFKDVDSIYEGRLRGNQLMLSGLNLTLDEIFLLCNSSKIEEVSWLDLDDNRLGDEGIKVLAECKFLTHIQYLNLNSNNISDMGIKALANSLFLSKLKRLHLKNNPISGEGIVALFNSETLQSLQTFQVHDGWSCKKREGWRYKSKD